MPVSVAICEDERAVRKELAELVGSAGFGLDCFESAEGVLESGKDYDIYILDINMPGKNGMELAEKIRQGRGYNGNYKRPVIIFVTALSEYMQFAFDVQAFHFLTKPVNAEKFLCVLHNAAQSLRAGAPEQLSVKIGGFGYGVPLDELFYLESVGKKVALYTKAGNVECYGKIGEFAAKLRGSPMFFQCHRCYIVNMAYIARFSQKELCLVNGQIISLSRERYQDFLEAYSMYVMK